MYDAKGSAWRVGAIALAAVLISATATRAEVTVDNPGSIIIYPKIVADGSRDTLIQISNTSNMLRFVHCFYIDTFGTCSTATAQACRRDSDCPATETCNRACNPSNFDLVLTAQQPVMWRVSTGRLSSLTPPPCRQGVDCTCTIDPMSGQQICPGFELATAGSTFVPGTGTEFEGELKCYETDGDGFPMVANSLKGTATIETLGTTQVSEYNALTIAGNTDLVVGNNFDRELRLNYPGGATPGEYNYCPSNLVFTHFGIGAVEPFSNATVSTEITLVPCTELIEEGEPATTIVNFVGFNEFEQRLSADGVDFGCYFNRRLEDIPSEGQGIFTAAAGQRWKMRVTPSTSNLCMTGTNRGLPCTLDSQCPGFLTGPGGTTLGCRPAPGVLGVVEEFYTTGGQPDGIAAKNVHVEGQRTGFGDIITTP